MNTFIDNNDYLGLIQAEPDSQSFFNIEKYEYFDYTFDRLDSPTELYLSDLEKTYEREVYTFMEALGDFGGFNDGVLIIPAILMHIYSSKMYLQALFSLLPVKKIKISGARKRMKDKLNEGSSSPFELTEADAQMLAKESGRVRLQTNSWLSNLCFVKCICRKSRGMRLQEKAIAQFEDSLDIRSIVKTRIDLSILLRVLLSKEQLVLFRNQHARAFTAYNPAS